MGTGSDSMCTDTNSTSNGTGCTGNCTDSSDIPHICPFCTPTHFEVFENCTPKKCVNLRQKLPRDITAYVSIF